jgi:hypothetical protein
MRRVLSELRESADVRAVLGDAVRPEPAWYLNGSPWVHGSVRTSSPHPTPLTLLPQSPPPTPLFYCFFFFWPRVKTGEWGKDGVMAKVRLAALISPPASWRTLCVYVG